MSGNTRLTDGFREIIELRWDEFIALEKDQNQSNFDAIISALVRACVKGNLRAIQVSLDRLDGPIAQEIDVEFPKFYTVYPQATMVADDPKIIDLPDGEITLTEQPQVMNIIEVEEELPTGSLRAVLERMLDAPKQDVTNILAASVSVDKGDLTYGNPLVKSVIVAGLMKLVHDGRINAVFEIFTQIDGKVKEKYKLLGDDVYIQNYSKIAPAGATLNADGIYQIAADNTTNAWALRLEEKNVKKR